MTENHEKIMEKIMALQERCPGCTFQVVEDSHHGTIIRIVEYGRSFIVRGFMVTEDSAELPGDWPENWFDYEIARRPLAKAPALERDEKYRVVCPNCGPITIGYGMYMDQLRRPDTPWFCPSCGSTACFDEATYERYEEGGEQRVIG